MAILPGQSSTGNTRNLLFASGDQGAAASVNQDLAQNAAQSPSKLFSAALLDLLKRYQTLGTRRFQETQFSGQEEQSRRIFDTPSSLIGANPSLQSSVRSAASSAVQPTITGAQQGQQTFTEQIRSLGDSLTQAQEIGKFLVESEEKEAQNARDLIFKVPGAVKKLGEQERRKLEQKAGLQKGLIDLLPEEEPKLTQVDLGDRVAFVDAQGNEVKSIKKGLKPEDVTTTSEDKVQEAADSISLINELIPKTREISGVFRTGRVTGSYDKLKQLTSKLALGARKLIKGSGTVSDYEAKVLSDSTNSLGGARLSEKFIEQELKKIRGVLRSNAGENVDIKIIDPQTGQLIDEGPLNREDIADASIQGYIIEYK